MCVCYAIYYTCLELNSEIRLRCMMSRRDERDEFEDVAEFSDSPANANFHTDDHADAKTTAATQPTTHPEEEVARATFLAAKGKIEAVGKIKAVVNPKMMKKACQDVENSYGEIYGYFSKPGPLSKEQEEKIEAYLEALRGVCGVQQLERYDQERFAHGDVDSIVQNSVVAKTFKTPQFLASKSASETTSPATEHKSDESDDEFENLSAASSVDEDARQMPNTVKEAAQPQSKKSVDLKGVRYCLSEDKTTLTIIHPTTDVIAEGVKDKGRDKKAQQAVVNRLIEVRNAVKEGKPPQIPPTRTLQPLLTSLCF